MPELFRVLPWRKASTVNEPGGALDVLPQGSGRIDNPAVYSVLYLSDSAPGAIAEAFGRFPEWTPSMLGGIPGLPGSIRALARYYLNDSRRHGQICNLDDARRLLALHLRPSEVVSRDYIRTRAWALRIHNQGVWAGIRWWSYYEPAWSSFGLWDLRTLTLEDVTPLHLDHPDLIEASRTIVRRVTTTRARR